MEKSWVLPVYLFLPVLGRNINWATNENNPNGLGETLSVTNKAVPPIYIGIVMGVNT